MRLRGAARAGSLVAIPRCSVSVWPANDLSGSHARIAAQRRAQAWTTMSDTGEVGRRQPAQRPTVPQDGLFLNHGRAEVNALAGVLDTTDEHAAQQTAASGRIRQGFTRGLTQYLRVRPARAPPSAAPSRP